MRNKTRNTQIKVRPKRKLVALLCLACFFGLTYLLLRTSAWNGEKLVVVFGSNDKNAIVVFDPKEESMVIIDIPNNLRVEAARDLGEWSFPSLWQLGRDEGVGGQLAADTLTLSLSMPTFGYSDYGDLRLIEGDMGGVVKALLGRAQSTNLSHGDRIRMAFFSFQVGNIGRHEVSLVDTGALAREDSKGEEVYKVKNDLPERILSYFVDKNAALESKKIRIVNETGDLVYDFADTLGVLGGRILAVDQGSQSSTYCDVYGPDSYTLSLLEKHFGCTKKGVHRESNFDIEIVVGKEFLRRF